MEVLWLATAVAAVIHCSGAMPTEGRNMTTCKMLFPPAIPFGMKFFEHLPPGNREKHMACYNITKEEAMQRDQAYESKKAKCLAMVLPNVDAGMREAEACKIATEGTNMSGSVFWNVGQIRRCIADYVLFPEENEDEMDLEKIRSRCLEEAFPSHSEHDRIEAFRNLTMQAKMLGEKYFDMRDKLDICMHEEMLHKEDQEEYRTNLPHCQSKLFPGHTMSQVEEKLDREMQDGNYDIHVKLHACVYMMSTKAQWELQNFFVVQSCADQVYSNVSGAMKDDVQMLYQKYMDNATIDQMMECHSRRLHADVKKGENDEMEVTCRPPNYPAHPGKRPLDPETQTRRNVVSRMVGDCIRRIGPNEINRKYEEKMRNVYIRSNAAAECISKTFRPNVFRSYEK